MPKAPRPPAKRPPKARRAPQAEATKASPPAVVPSAVDPRELFRSLAGDLADAGFALDAEMMLSTMLGLIYGMVDKNRDEAVTEFAEGLGHFARQEGEIALWATVNVLLPGRVPAAQPLDGPASDGPAWLPVLGQVRLTGTYAYGDSYGDQVSYLASFAYPDEDLGGPEHAVVVLVDHNLGFVKDVFVGTPAAEILDSARATAAGDPHLWFRAIDPGELRAAVATHLAHTDELSTLPASESLPADRAFALARLALLPGDGTPDEPPRALSTEDRAALLKSFRTSAPAKKLTVTTDNERDSLTFCLNMIIDWAGEHRDGQPLRWSPASVELFLLDWAPRKALLDKTDIALLPRALDAWARWAGRRTKLSAAAVTATLHTIGSATEEFTRLATSGEARSPATRMVAAMIAEGVNLDDVAAVERWMAEHNT